MNRHLEMNSEEDAPGMRVLVIQKYRKPEDYEILRVPVPKVSGPNDLVVKVHASSINPIDVKVASSVAKLFCPQTFPYKFGYDFSGTITSISPDLCASRPDLKIGAEVFSSVPEHCHGTASEYALSTADATALKPKSISHTEAASLPLASLTALQSLDIAAAHFEDGLKGKTVFVPGWLSGTGSTAIQLAKRVFGRGKVLTTVSTAKVGKIAELLGSDVVDQVIDYTQEDPAKVIPAGSVDFMFNTMGLAMEHLLVMKKGGIIVSISGTPFGPGLREKMPTMPALIRWLLNSIGGMILFQAWRYWATYTHCFMHPSADDLYRWSGWVDEGKLRRVVGRVASLEDPKDVRQACEEIYQGKGGIGKFVIEVDVDASRR